MHIIRSFAHPPASHRAKMPGTHVVSVLGVEVVTQRRELAESVFSNAYIYRQMGRILLTSR